MHRNVPSRIWQDCLLDLVALRPQDHDQPMKRAIFLSFWVPNLKSKIFLFPLTLSSIAMYSKRMTFKYEKFMVPFFHTKSLMHQWMMMIKWSQLNIRYTEQYRTWLEAFIKRLLRNWVFQAVVPCSWVICPQRSKEMCNLPLFRAIIQFRDS